MNYLFIFTILVVGLSGIIAQILILRELLVSFYGNELTLGIILANWVILEAAGVFIVGKLIERIKNKINVLLILEIIFSLTLPLTIYLSRVFKDILGIPFGEAIGLPLIFSVSFLIILPLSFCHGALFSTGCKLYSLFNKDTPRSIGRVYTWETIGTISGGVILTYLFIPYLNSFQIAFIISITNLVITLIFLKNIANKKLKYITFLFLSGILVFYLFLRDTPNYLQRRSINRQWKGLEVLDYRNSIYGNILVARKQEQYTFFYNGIPIVTTPYPDITFVEEFGNLPLLFHPAAKDILIIGGGAGGLINEILKYPIKKLDYAELDPLIIQMLKKFPSKLTEKEISDARVNIINLDGRFFLKSASCHYDIILIGLSKASDLSTNRLFTQEFFSLAKNKLKPDGILAIWLPGSLTYLSKELRDLNACIFNALKNTYDYVRIIPGDYNIFLASGSSNILKIDSLLLVQKINRFGIKTNLLTPSYLDYRLNKKWLDWFKNSSLTATKKINQDFLPFAVFQMLIFWNKQFSHSFSRFLESFQYLDLKIISGLIFMITILFFYITKRKRGRAKFNIAYSIATTGFFGMLMNLILIFSFQIFYGYLYYRIGILISIFMAGIATGSIFITERIEKIKNAYNLFIRLELIIILFSYLLALMITRFSSFMYGSSMIFMVLFFIPGLFLGLEFPLASKIYSDKNKPVGETAGLLYCADLIGGWIAGILGGIIFLPILGLFNTCLVIVILKLSSVVLLVAGRREEIAEKV